jgi:hypothetical protein
MSIRFLIEGRDKRNKEDNVSGRRDVRSVVCTIGKVKSDRESRESLDGILISRLDGESEGG